MFYNIQAIPIETGVFTWSKANSGYEIADVERSELVNFVTQYKDKYALAGGRCIVPKDHMMSPERNLLEDCPKLFTEFSEIGYEEKEIVYFANKYGLLLPRESFKMTAGIKVSDKSYCEGESVEFWKNQIRLIHTTLAYWQWFVHNNTDALRKVTSTSNMLKNDGIIFGFEFPHYSQWFSFLKSQLNELNDIPIQRLMDGDIESRVKFFVQQTINNQLKEFPVEPCLVFDKENNLKQYYRPSSLISLLWFQFFRYVTGEQKVKQCPLCKDWYDVSGNVSRDGNKSVIWDKYCPCCGNKLYAKKSIVKKQYQQLKMTKDEILSRHRRKDHKLIKEWITELESSPKTP